MESEDISKAKQKELDAILDAALDELDDDDDDDEYEDEVDDNGDDGNVIDCNDTSTIPIRQDSDSNNNNTKTINTNSVEDEETSPTSKTQQQTPNKRPVFGPEVPPSMSKKKSSLSSSNHPKNPNPCDSVPSSSSEEEKAIQDMMRHMEALLSGNNNNHHHETDTISNQASVTQKSKEPSISSSSQSSSQTNNKTKSKSKSKPKSSNDNQNMEDTMSQLFEKLSQNINNDDINDDDLGDFSAMGDEFMKQMAKEWEETIGGDSSRSTGTNNQKLDAEEQEEVVGQVVNGMMKQLLSKEFMYEPMKDICNQFPTWLAENKSKLNEKEYERYGKQYQYFQKIVHVYEHEYDDNDDGNGTMARLTELMHDVQEFGQPPKELIKTLAPDLDFDESGMPKMDGAGFGPMMNQECNLM